MAKLTINRVHNKLAKASVARHGHEEASASFFADGRLGLAVCVRACVETASVK